MADRQHLLIVNEFHAETLGKLDSLYHTHHLWRFPQPRRAALIDSLQGRCRAAATASWVCDELTWSLQSLELLAAYGVGVDGIDLHRAGRQNIRVTHTPGVLDDAVADVAIALVLATMRNLINADRFVKSGAWSEQGFPLARSLAGKTLGIIGLGRIGAEIAHRALALRMKIAYHNRSPKNLPYSYHPSLTELARHSDVLLSVLPGGEQTRRIVNAGILESLGPQGIFINVGRGSSVDETALIAALRERRIAGAGLDVYENEPQVPQALRQLDNVVLFPHVGSGTVETRGEMGNLVIRNLEAFFAGEPLPTEVPGAHRSRQAAASKR